MGRDLCRVIVLGSTGSIGTQTIEVVEHLNALHEAGAWGTRYQIVGLAAGGNVELLRAQAARLRVAHTCHRSGSSGPGEARAATSTLTRESMSSTASTARDAEHLVRTVECDLVVAAISGFAGLAATLAAVELGRDVALANKETLVAAGALITAAARGSGSHLLPVDSEHSGVWQCLPSTIAPPVALGEDISRITLTASGGPFRAWSRSQMQRATVEDALKHPTWNMGRKVTIDSATLMNKALEVVEAHWLFGVPGDRISVVIHPQSIVHAMVEFADGSTISQMGAPDMRTPIQHALTWPRRAPGCSKKLGASPMLEFEPPDLERFPGLSLAYRALREGGSAGAVMNAANEAAVEAFLSGRIPFTRIASTVEHTMNAIGPRPIHSLSDCLDADSAARAHARNLCSRS